MCGIVGSVGTRVDRDRFSAQVATLLHRGPDGGGTTYLRDDTVALGHRRLAIVDLSSAGDQPMSSDDGRVHVVFNGEIYNHPDLRRTLESRGHRYRSESDTESIIHAYREWGDRCVDHFDGIFAFGLWDDRRGCLLLARDRVGVKPLFYAVRDGSLVFASQPRAMLDAMPGRPSIDPQGFVDYLSHGIVPDERSAFAGVAKLPPGHTMTWCDGRVEVQRYWAPGDGFSITDFDEATALVRDAVERSIVAQLMSDVPIATFLSGGIDSSIVTAIAERHLGDQPGGDLHSLTVGFEEQISDERRYARAVSQHCGTASHEAVLTHADGLALIDEVVEAYDEPFGMNAAIPMLFIARMTHEAGFKVVLSGDGADELFIGYHHHDALARRYARWGLASADRVANWARFLPVRAVYGAFDPLQHYEPHDGMIPLDVQRRVLSQRFVTDHDPTFRWRLDDAFDRTLPATAAARRLDFGTYLPDEILGKVDRATMAYGVEARVPFLSNELVDLAFAIDPVLHHRGGERKAVLKAAAAAWLPPGILSNRKKGFSLRLDEWLLAPAVLADMIDLIVDGDLVDAGILDDRALRTTLLDLAPNVVYQLYLAERWARRWIR